MRGKEVKKEEYINADSEWINVTTIQGFIIIFLLRQHSSYGAEIPLTSTQKWELKYLILIKYKGKTQASLQPCEAMEGNIPADAVKSPGPTPRSLTHLLHGLGHLLNLCEQQFP